MAEKVDLSLDDIIKMSKKQRGGGGNNSKPNLQRLRNLGARSGLIRKGGPKQVSRNNQHQSQGQQKKEPTMLHVSNLHYNVSNEDVRELFADIGTIKKAAVHYDKSGRSLGTAEVIFTTREAALRAIRKYHNLPLDGRPMTITLVPGQNSNRSPTKSRIGVKPGSGIYKKSQTTKNNKGGGQFKGRSANNTRNKPKFQRGQRQPKETVTAEELDAELEAYAANTGV